MPAHSQRVSYSLLVLLLLGSCVRAVAATIPRYPVQPSSVVSALSYAGVDLQVTDISLPVALTAAEQFPQFVIGSAESEGSRQVRVRLSCRHAGVCVPFFAELTLEDAAQTKAALQRLQALFASDRAPASATGVLRAGQHTVLFLEDNFMRISLPVISIDTGVAGAEVRVGTLDHKQSFRGIVTDDGTVRSALP